MISSDDCSYSPTSAHEILTEMESNKKLIVVSAEAKNSSNLVTRGNGRFIRNSIYLRKLFGRVSTLKKWIRISNII